MNRLSGLFAVCSGVNNRSGSISDIASSADTSSTSCQCSLIKQQATPCSHLYARPFWQEGWIGCFTDSDQNNISGHIILRTWNRHWLAASPYIRLSQLHTLALDTAYCPLLRPQNRFGSDQFVQDDTL